MSDTDDECEAEDDPQRQTPKRRKRASMFYKQYLQRDSVRDVPRTTLIPANSRAEESSRSMASVNQQESEAEGEASSSLAMEIIGVPPGDSQLILSTMEDSDEVPGACNDTSSASSPGDGHSSPPPGDGHSSPPPGDGHSSPSPGDGHSSPPSGDGHSSPSPGDGHSSPPPGDGHSSPPSGDGHSSPPPGDGHSSPPSGDGHSSLSSGDGHSSPPPGDGSPDHGNSSSSESENGGTSSEGENSGSSHEAPEAPNLDFDGQFVSRAEKLHSHSLNSPLFRGEGGGGGGPRKTRFECLLLVLCFAVRHGLTDVAVEDLLKLINCLLVEVSPLRIPDTLHVFHQVFSFNSGLEYHFYCSFCEDYIGKKSDFGKDVKSVNCPTELCRKPCNMSNLDQQNFFVILPLQNQLKTYLETKPDIMESLSYRFDRDQCNDTIQDIFDGELYKRLSAEGGILSDVHNFSLTVNADGTPVFLSNTKSLWPIFCRINETKVSERFSSDNLFLGGIWFGKNHPNMTLFLGKYALESRKLEVEGLKWTKPSGESVTSKVVTINGTFDSVAKPDAQGVKQFNAYQSCGYCYHPGDLVNLTHNVIIHQEVPDDQNNPSSVRNVGESETDNAATAAALGVDSDEEEEEEEEEERGVESDLLRPAVKVVKQVRFTNKRAGSYTDRTDAEIRADMAESVASNKVVRGVKTVSPFIVFGFFDLVYGFCIDYMHGVLLGVVRLLLSLWLEPKFKDREHYIRGRMGEIDARLLNLKPPISISRRPQSVKDFRKWKANELRSWLLYYCLPCSKDILPDKYLKHVGLLVTSIYLLSSDKIHLRDFNLAQDYLEQFVKDFETYYGPAHMVYNVHLLTHLTKCVRFWGPLWAYSAFTFENGIGTMKKLIKGTRGVISQITRKYSIYRFLPKVTACYEVGDNVAEFCKDLLIVRKQCHTVERVNEITLFESSRAPLVVEIRQLLEENNIPSDVPIYTRFIYKGVVFYTKSYLRPKQKSNDFTILLKDGSYGVIECCLVWRNGVYLVVRSINLAPNAFVVQNGSCKAAHIKVCGMYPFGDLKLLRVNDLSRKCLYLDARNNESYVTVSPNSCEKD